MILLLWCVMRMCIQERINLLTGQIEKAAQKTASAAVTGGGPGNIGLPKSAPSKVSVLQSPLQIDSKSSKRPVLTHQGTSRGHDSVCVLCTPGQHHAPDHLLLVSDLPEGHHSLFQSLHHGKNATVIDVKPEQPSLTPKAYSPPQLLATPKAAAPTSGVRIAV